MAIEVCRRGKPNAILPVANLQSPFAAVLFPTCRLADKFRLGRSLALPICPPTEVGGYEKKKKPAKAG
jgi:hypothetical protein